MRLFFFSRILLALHFGGIVMMMGATMIDYFTFRTFWKLIDDGQKEAFGLLPLMTKFGGLIRTGGIIVIITGISILAIDKWALANQFWFKLKIALVLLLILNGIFVGNKNGVEFRNQIAKNAPDFIRDTTELRTTLHGFYIIQLAIFILLILISTIKFETLKQTLRL